MADDAFSQFGQGMERGVKLAQHAEQLTQQREQLEVQKQEASVKQSDWFGNQVATILQTPNKELRKANLERLAVTARQLNIYMDPNIAKLAGDEKFVNDVLSVNSHIMGLPPDQKSAAWQAAQGSLGDAVKFNHIINASAESLNRQRDTSARAAQGPDMMKMADDIRRERSGLAVTKNTAEIATAYEKIQNVMQDPSPAGDLSLIFAYMKMLDPGSTVREGEQASAQNTAGVPDRVRGLYNRIISGERLMPEQRADFLKQAHGLYKAQATRQAKVDQTYTELARSRGIDPKHLFIGFGGQEEMDQQTMAARQKVDDRNKAAAGQVPTNQTAESQAKPDALDPNAARMKAYKIHGIDPKDANAEQKLNRALIIQYRPEEARRLGLIPNTTAKSGGRK